MQHSKQVAHHSLSKFENVEDGGKNVHKSQGIMTVWKFLLKKAWSSWLIFFKITISVPVKEKNIRGGGEGVAEVALRQFRR